MLPEINRETGHSIGCQCDECKESFTYRMSKLMNFIGQRADKVVVRDILEGDETDNPVMVKNGVEREIVSYTMSCPDDDCGGDGYYDDIGEVICEDCGVVISGEKRAALPVEYNADDKGSVGSSRGLEKMPGTRNSRGTQEPRI